MKKQHPRSMLVAYVVLIVLAWTIIPKPAPSPTDPPACVASVCAQLCAWVWHKAEEGVAYVVGWVASDTVERP